ncbi:MAG: HDIG domain-containing protein [Kiritimatiellae bacterium]|nr:HDIG domain-containing protein [Kiritimatiellia bacterium]
MRLSHLLEQSGKTLPEMAGTGEPKAAPAPARTGQGVAPAKPPRRGPVSVMPQGGEPADEGARSEQAPRREHSGTPAEAAASAGVSMPQNKEATLTRAKGLLAKLFLRCLDSGADKRDVWPAAQSIAADLGSIISLDASIARVLYRTTKKEERLVNHSVNTALFALDLAADGSWLRSATREEVGAAALLHDIGIAALGMDCRLDEANRKYRQHVSAAIDLLDSAQLPDVAVRMIAQHHERLDGSGFPGGISGEEFAPCSQVLALANVFEHTVGDIRPKGRSPVDETDNYMQYILKAYRKAFDREWLKRLLSKRGFYPVGSMVELNNRSICLVLEEHEGFPLRPVVQVMMDGAGRYPEEPRIIDLCKTDALSIIRSVDRGHGEGSLRL